MWTRVGPLGNDLKWEPNHFVPCFRVPTENVHSIVPAGSFDSTYTSTNVDITSTGSLTSVVPAGSFGSTNTSTSTSVDTTSTGSLTSVVPAGSFGTLLKQACYLRRAC